MCKSTECQNCKNNNGVWVISNEILDKETLDNIFKEALSEINKGACKATVKIVPQEEIDNILNKYIGEQVSEEKVESSTIEVTKESVKGKVEKKGNKPYSFVEDMKERDKIHAGLINLISRYAIDNGMTLKAINECMEQITELYYRDAMIRKGE
ncbi:hypothetical protein QJR26_03355 [Clostridium baratii]